MLTLDAEALSPAALTARWCSLVLQGDLVDDDLRSVEMDQHGKIFLSPRAVKRHQLLAGHIANQMRDHLGGYGSAAELSILTRIGVRCPDAIWTADVAALMADPADPLTRAPEICVEVASPSNTLNWLLGKAAAYLDAGACEVVLVELDGRIRYLGTDGERTGSAYGLRLTLAL